MIKPIFAYLTLTATIICLSVPVRCVSATKTSKETSVIRNLADYTNDNGKAPTGKDSQTDDSSALRKALADGPGVVQIGPGFYRWSKIAIPSDVMVIGSGAATVVRPSGSGYIFEQQDTSGWAIRDIILDGQSEGDWRLRQDLGLGGISATLCRMYDISNVTLRNFSGVGLQISTFHKSTLLAGGGGNFNNIQCYGNHTGIRFDDRAEYGNASMLTCANNVIGCIIHAGNVKISTSNFGSNVDGLVIDDKANGSHGIISDCMMNHNDRYALLCKNVQYGMIFQGCCFFYGEVRMENSKGVNITNGAISCTVTTTGTGANRISGNYIIADPPWKFEFAPSTIVKDNFTGAGPWDRNSP